MFILDWIINYIFRNPPILLAIIAMIGLLLQRKSFADIVKGMFLTAFGLMIIQVGVGLLVDAILPVNIAFQGLTGEANLEGLNDATFVADFGADIGLAMAIALVLHVIIARFTPIKTIFLTGHFLWWFPFIFIAAGVEAGLRGMPLVLMGAICSALYWSLMPWALRKYVFEVIGDESWTLGHPTGILSLIAAFVASKVGDKSKSTEDLNMPKGISFFREISISGAIIITIMYLFTWLFVDREMFEGGNFFMGSLQYGLLFGIGLITLLSGVRMLISQIVPAFRGISEKLVPKALPAFDCPLIFNYRPNAVIIGFVVAMIVSTPLIIITNSFNLFGVMLIPLIISGFFECGTASVLAEGQGGLRGSIIGTAVAAVVMVGLIGLAAMVYTTTILNWQLIFGGNDQSLWGVVAYWISRGLGGLF